MKKLATVVLALCLLFSCIGCNPSPYAGKNVELFTVAAHSVAGAGWRGGRTEIVETDAYGRVLFSYTQGYLPHPLADCAGLCVYAICQQSDRKFTYYYEDICFIAAPSWEAFAPDDIERLKEINDWEQELEPELMSKQKRARWPDGVKRYNAEGCSYDVGVAEADKIVNRDMYGWSGGKHDVDQAGKTLYFIRTYKNRRPPVDPNSVVLFVRAYFMILNTDGTYDPENYLIEVPDIFNYQELLHELKERNGWSKKAFP